MEVLGIDIGGSGMKGAIVDVETGKMLTKRFRVPTPPSRKPDEMAQVISQIIAHFKYTGPVGCGFPTVIKNGICKSTGNLHKTWKNVAVDQLFSEVSGHQVTVVNDADAAGYAEINYGSGKGKKGFVVMITIGTGLGSGAFLEGRLIPNFELGQIPYKKHAKIELWAAASAKEREGLSYEKWGKRFNKFLKYVDLIIAPDLMIIGGGTSKHFNEFQHLITVDTPIVQAQLLNHAGIIGAAAAVVQK
ncbi:polyphosphate--glucose phosphotransferase [Spongiimicrobium salis]|uniref:polyphosphate--glucose phosphotransferase n=1 Tax=Spongiimicrobium salis TaxID=1667022 RepID=UPI00374D8D37